MCSKYDFKAKKRKRGKDAQATSDDDDQELEQSVRAISALLQRAQKGDLTSVLELGDLMGMGGLSTGNGLGLGLDIPPGVSGGEDAEVRSRRIENMRADVMAALAARARHAGAGGLGETGARTGVGVGVGAIVRESEEDEDVDVEEEEEVDELDEDAADEARAGRNSSSAGVGPSGSGAGTSGNEETGIGRAASENVEGTSAKGKALDFALGMWDEGDESDAFPIPLRARKSSSKNGSTAPSQTTVTAPSVSGTVGVSTVGVEK